MCRCGLTLLTLLASLSIYGSDYATQVHVWTGDPAAVTAPANATHDPGFVQINDNGDLLFQSYVSGDGPSRIGIFLIKGGETKLIVARGDYIPDDPVPVDQLVAHWLDQTGQVLAMTSDATYSNYDLTLWDEEGPLPIVRPGQPLRPGDYPVTTVRQVRFCNDRVAYIASFDTDHFDDEGVYLDDQGVIKEIARRDTGSAPGASDAVPSYLDMVRLNSSGDVFFAMDYKAADEQQLVELNGFVSNRGYYVYYGAFTDLIARRYQTMPGGKILNSVGNASINQLGQVAFIGYHTDNTAGVYRYGVIGGLELLFKSGDTAGGLTIATGPQGTMTGIQIANSSDVMVVATVAGTTTFPNSDGIIRFSDTRGLELLAYETQVAPSPVIGQTFHYQHFARASMNRDGVIAIDAVMQEKPVFDAITNHVLYIENPFTHQMEVAANPGQTISHSQGSDVMVRLNSFAGILEQPGPPPASGSGEDGSQSVFNQSKIHVAILCGRVRDGFGMCTILPALVVNKVGDEPDADLTDDLPDIDPDTEGNQLTLRAAIQNANKRLGRDTIIFNIPPEQGVGGFFIIDIDSPLPEITEAVTIDGKSQPGYAGVPRVSVDGGVKFLFKRDQPQIVAKGLVLKADECNISGLAFNQFPGAAIEVHQTNRHVITDNYIGLDSVAEATGYGNRIGVSLDRSAGNVIKNNIISGNGVGIFIEDFGPLETNLISDNKIGTNAAGTGNNANLFAGIQIFSGDGNIIENNVIGWNAPSAVIISEHIDTRVGGIVVYGQDTAATPLGNIVRKNFIGVAKNGSTPLPNYNGIVVDDSNNIHIGELGKGNVISGNYDAGVKLLNIPLPAGGMPGADIRPLAGFPFGLGFGELPPLASAPASSFAVTITDNNIGSNTPGTVAVANNVGILVLDSSAVFIDYNQISGNKLEGIMIDGTGRVATHNVVNANVIGATGGALAALPNRNGIYLYRADHNVIQANYILANNEVGVYFEDSQQNFTVQNQIGSTGLGNKNSGIYCFFSAFMFLGAGPGGDYVYENGNCGIYVENCNNIGVGQEYVDKNMFGGVYFKDSTACVVDSAYITNNKGAGILADGGGNNHYLPLSVEKNDGLAIDLLNDGVTENDLNDADDGPSGLQNFPVLDSLVTLGGGDYFIAGRLTGLPNTLYKIDFFDTPDTDPSKHGEGSYFWYRTIVTDENGFARFTADPRGVGALANVSATATPWNLRRVGTGTSEFSLSIKPIAVGIDLVLTQTTPSAPVKVNTPVEVNLTVTNKGISKAPKVVIDGVLNPGFKISSFTSTVGAVGTRTPPAFAYEVGDLEPSASANVKLTLIPIKPGPLTQVLNTHSDIFDAKIGDNRVETMIFAYTTDPVAGNQPPSVPSGVSATPNPAFQYGPVAFEALASDPENQTLSFLWNFGDETDSVVTTTGQTTHRFAEAGQFTVKLTCFDASGAATEATVIVFVTALGNAPGDNDGDSTMNPDDTDDDNDGVPDSQDADLDGDSVTNDVELDKGSNPNDKTSFPASEDGDNDGIPNTIDPDVDNDTLPNGTDPDIDGDGASNQDEQLAGTDPYNNTSKPGTMTITKFASALRFDVTGKDTLQVTGQIPDISSGEVLTGKSFSLSVGNSTQRFVLDAKGKAKTPLATVAVVKPKASKTNPNVIGPATFALKAKGTLAAALLAGVSLDPAPTSVTLTFVVKLGDRNGLTSRNATIAVKKGKTGQPASAKLGLPKTK